MFRMFPGVRQSSSYNVDDSSASIYCPNAMNSCMSGQLQLLYICARQSCQQSAGPQADRLLPHCRHKIRYIGGGNSWLFISHFDIKRGSSTAPITLPIQNNYVRINLPCLTGPGFFAYFSKFMRSSGANNVLRTGF